MGNCLNSYCSCCCKDDDAPTAAKPEPPKKITSQSPPPQRPQVPDFMNGPPSPTTVVRDSMAPPPAPEKARGGVLLQGGQQGQEAAAKMPPKQATMELEAGLHLHLHMEEEEEEEGSCARRLPAVADIHKLLPPAPSPEQPRSGVLHKKEEAFHVASPEQREGRVVPKKEEGLHAPRFPAPATAAMPENFFPWRQEQQMQRNSERVGQSMGVALPTKTSNTLVAPLPRQEDTRSLLQAAANMSQALFPSAKEERGRNLHREQDRLI